MTTSIPAILPVDELSRLAAAGAAPAAAPPVAPELAQKFEALMTRADDGAHAVGAPGHNVVSHMIERQQVEMQQVEQRAGDFLQAAPHMDAATVMATSMALSRDMAVVGMKLQVATSLTQGSSKSLQTLLKNQ